VTPRESVCASEPVRDCHASDLACRQSVEILIDDMAEQSFPASDAPSWGIASSRCEQAVSRSRTDQKRCSVHHT
jgi:hypothetical protein